MNTITYWVFVKGSNMVAKPYWRAFDHIISALLFAKINGYKLIAIGKDNV